MKKYIFSKFAGIILLTFLLLIPLGMIKDVISDRVHYRNEASQSIRQSWSSEQSIIGPILFVPYEESRTRRVWDEKLKDYRQQNYSVEHQQAIMPESLKVNGVINSEERRRGLYRIPVYRAKLDIMGSFNLRRLSQIEKENPGRIKWKTPYLSVFVSDIRGLDQLPEFQWNQQDMDFESGSLVSEKMSGMHVKLEKFDPEKLKLQKFSLQFPVRGMQKIAFSPLGKDTSVDIEADWPHPSFIGRYLPSDYHVDSNRFNARWQASSFTSNLATVVDACAKGNCNAISRETFGVSLIDPVDVYALSERSIKYGVLFLALTFLLFFLFEVMKRLLIHPVQYSFAGMALAVFFLLLVSLSEHLEFILAYWISALGCVAVLSTYLAAIFKNLKQTLGFCVTLLALYAMLYVILQSEDSALLMGSLLLFFMLSLAMLTTRHIDWYRVEGIKSFERIDTSETEENQKRTM